MGMDPGAQVDRAMRMISESLMTVFTSSCNHNFRETVLNRYEVQNSGELANKLSEKLVALTNKCYGYDPASRSVWLEKNTTSTDACVMEVENDVNRLEDRTVAEWELSFTDVCQHYDDQTQRVPHELSFSEMPDEPFYGKNEVETVDDLIPDSSPSNQMSCDTQHTAKHRSDTLLHDYCKTNHVESRSASPIADNSFQHQETQRWPEMTIGGFSLAAVYKEIIEKDSGITQRITEGRCLNNDSSSSALSGRDLSCGGGGTATSGVDIAQGGGDTATSGVDIAQGGGGTATSGVDISQGGGGTANSGVDISQSGGGSACTSGSMTAIVSSVDSHLVPQVPDNSMNRICEELEADITLKADIDSTSFLFQGDLSHGESAVLPTVNADLLPAIASTVYSHSDARELAVYSQSVARASAASHGHAHENLERSISLERVNRKSLGTTAEATNACETPSLVTDDANSKTPIVPPAPQVDFCAGERVPTAGIFGGGSCVQAASNYSMTHEKLDLNTELDETEQEQLPSGNDTDKSKSPEQLVDDSCVSVNTSHGALKLESMTDADSDFEALADFSLGDPEKSQLIDDSFRSVNGDFFNATEPSPHTTNVMPAESILQPPQVKSYYTYYPADISSDDFDW